MRKFVLLFILGTAFYSCTQLNVFEQQVAFATHEWSSADKPSFTFKIADTGNLYNLFVVLRHEDAYRYKNIWLNITVKDPDSTYTIKREFPLADNSRWLGTGMEDVIEHRITFNLLPVRLKKGSYTFILQQAMREDPLDHILNAGIRVEKIKL